MKPAIFLDRDGTINKLFDKPYICDVSEVELLPFVKEVLQKLKQNWYLLIVVTNQTWVGAWYYTKQQAEKVNDKIQKLLWFRFDKIYSCYHAPESNCECRKPRLWLLKQALNDFEIDLEKSVMIGDKCKDIEFWKKAWLKTILIGDDNLCGADYVCKNWKEIEKILTNKIS